MGHIIKLPLPVFTAMIQNQHHYAQLNIVRIEISPIPNIRQASLFAFTTTAEWYDVSCVLPGKQKATANPFFRIEIMMLWQNNLQYKQFFLQLAGTKYPLKLLQNHFAYKNCFLISGVVFKVGFIGKWYFFISQEIISDQLFFYFRYHQNRNSTFCGGALNRLLTGYSIHGFRQKIQVAISVDVNRQYKIPTIPFYQ